ncbi:paraquat-inducible protein A [Pararhodospirillum oryzae]|uniref:Paraquat-inducible protein n=1 Tax=Pararhodospirillum oryzae TaxID=478448 RepID=A0A512H3R7_9PROT|nr:paraquat-inducible protein A [Pararhodospirillum oryzae]GEO80105.1 paraquat-inducible protein [Pararhodospirillum oryzae]
MNDPPAASASSSPPPSGRDLVACPGCDTLYARRSVRRGESAWCPTCGERLYGRPALTPEHLMGLVIAALITFLIASAWPIVEIRLQGIRNATTLSGAALALWQEGRRIVAALVFLTTQVIPLCDLLLVLAALVGARQGRGQGAAPAWAAVALRLLLHLRPWGMIEVFTLGIAVGLVKLSTMAHIVPGVALWAFGALTVLLAAILSFDLRSLWDAPLPAGTDAVPPPPSAPP